MPSVQLVQAIADYLQAGVDADQIPYLNTVFQYPPKLTNEGYFFKGSDPLHTAGAVVYVVVLDQNERRIALGGAHSGRKIRPYQVELLCFFRWSGRESQDAAANNNAFIDGMTGWIEADRTAGTSPQTSSGISGVVFQWGEGDINGGTDVQVRRTMPRPIRSGVTQVFSVISVTALELLVT